MMMILSDQFYDLNNLSGNTDYVGHASMVRLYQEKMFEKSEEFIFHVIYNRQGFVITNFTGLEYNDTHARYGLRVLCIVFYVEESTWE